MRWFLFRLDFDIFGLGFWGDGCIAFEMLISMFAPPPGLLLPPPPPPLPLPPPPPPLPFMKRLLFWLVVVRFAVAVA